MKNYQTEYLSQHINNLRISQKVSRLAYQAGNALYINSQCVLLSKEGEHYAFTVEDDFQNFKTDILFSETKKKVDATCSCNAGGFCSHKVAALLQLHEDLSQEVTLKAQPGMKYTREGMVKRVMQEREEKALNEKFTLEFADNIYGEHLITNQQNKSYKLTFYNFETKQGYCSCPDHYTNKLGTCKHLIYAFKKFETQYENKHQPLQEFPFLEIYLHPLKEYRVAWFYPLELPQGIRPLVKEYFGDEQHLSNKQLINFHGFIKAAKKHKFINIRPEVTAKVQKAIEQQALKDLKAKTPLNFGDSPISLYPYQKEGVEFIVFNRGVILADEVGLGKTLQAIVAAQFKRALFNLQSTLIVCPDSLIQHWQQEIRKTGETTCLIVKESTDFYAADSYFKIIGFDDFARLSFAFDRFAPDFLILDEAQKISNFDSDLVRIIRRVKRRDLLIITDSKPENQPMQFYTMVGLVDNTLLTPLWEFSYQHCLFDSEVIDKIVGYYNQENITRKLSSILLHREKEDVLNQLSKINKLIVPVNLKESQQIQHQKLAEEVLFILRNNAKTNYDWENAALLLNQMKKMTSLVLLSQQTQGSSFKLSEFKHFLFEKLSITQLPKKIIVFAEKEDARKQLLHFFKENRISVQLIKSPIQKEDLEKSRLLFKQNNQAQVLIMQEGWRESFMNADAFIYYDWVQNQSIVEERMEFMQQQNNIQPSVFVQFLSRNSIEDILYQLSIENILFYNELIVFLNLPNENTAPRKEVQNSLIKGLLSILKEKTKVERKVPDSQTSLFPPMKENASISLSGEEHKVFERPEIEKQPKEIDVRKLLVDAHVFLSDLYHLQTGKELPWKPDEIDIKIENNEFVLRIKRS